MRKISRIGIFAHPEKSEAVKFAQELETWCRQMNLEVFHNYEDGKLDAVLACGGDGFLVKTAEAIAERGFQIPIAGVDFGTLGFLTRIKPKEIGRRMDDLLEGRYVVTERNRLQAKWMRNGSNMGFYQALNDIYVERSEAGTIKFSVSISGKEPFTKRADGVLMATRTGSTAYNRVLGGPILVFERDFVLKMMGPTEIDNQNAFVISSDDTVEISNVTDNKARLVADGKQIGILRGIDRVKIEKSSLATRFIEFGDVDW
jgi:NAD+ kinase